MLCSQLVNFIMSTSSGNGIKIVIIVQARMTSTRLPGKVLKTVLGKSLLEHQIERLRRVHLADELVIATTVNPEDEPIVALGDSLMVPVCRGSEDDVLARYYETAVTHGADVIVRVTSDCPLIDPAVIDQVINYFLTSHPAFDYVSNRIVPSYPRGMDTEVFSFKSLAAAFNEGMLLPDREHVTPFIYRHPDRYALGNLSYWDDQSRHRWTVDTADDFELIRRIIEALYPDNPLYSLEDVLLLMDRHPDWFLINAHVEQKKLEY